MKELKLISVILFLAIVSATSAQAANFLPTLSAKYSKCQCNQKKKAAPLKSRVKEISENLPLPPVRQRSGNRCLNLKTDTLVSFKLLRSSDPAKQYPFLEDDGTRIHYCLSLEERFQFKSQITDINYFRSRVSGLNGSDGPKAPSCPFVPSTSPVRAMPTYQPRPDDPLLIQPRNQAEKILLRVTFLADGTIGPVEIEQSPSPLHSRLAREAARKIKFSPAWDNGPLCVTQMVEYGYLPLPGQNSTSTPSVELQMPFPGEIFNNSPRKVRFVWAPFRGANYYVLEVQYASSTTPTVWYPLPEIKESKTNHEMQFPGAVPGRWRVSVLLSDGTKSATSGWRSFAYEK